MARIPAEATHVSARSPTRARNAAAANADRQMFPVQTNRSVDPDTWFRTAPVRSQRGGLLILISLGPVRRSLV
ncbi:hypothetical protein [Cutibacterium granulosum]|uniref:hypothetical protein n=1 Tax=Cutibacterium granulosum TaxID=33011 RepID=UPI001E43B349|nr:hypothetical protein [Cutibacterium granulosum]